MTNRLDLCRGRCGLAPRPASGTPHLLRDITDNVRSSITPVLHAHISPLSMPLFQTDNNGALIRKCLD